MSGQSVRFFLLPIFLACCFASLPVVAQDDESSTTTPATTIEDEVVVEAEPYRLTDEATTALKVPVPFRLQPLTAGAFGAELLAEQNATTIFKAIENSAGVLADKNGGSTELFYVRGFESIASGQLLIDGVGDPESTRYDLYNIDRVEVVRGPAGFLYGNSLAGVINLVTKAPPSSNRGSATVAGGDHSTLRGAIDYGLRTGSDLGFRLNAVYEESDTHRDTGAYDLFAINPSLDIPIGEAANLRIDAEYLTQDGLNDSGIPILLLTNEIADVDRETSYQSPFDMFEQDVTRLRASYDRQLSANITLTNTLFYRDLDWVSDGTLINGAAPSPPLFRDTVFRTLALLDDNQTFWGNQFDLLFAIDKGNVRHDLVVGIEYERQTDDFSLDFALLDSIDLRNPVETATGFFILPGFGFAGDTETEVIAPYVLDTLTIGDKWVVSLGARYDSISFEDAVTNSDDDSDRVSPFVGVLYAPSERLSLFANWGQSFDPPSTLVAPAERDNEEGENVEVGIKARLFDDAVDLTLSVYELEKENILIPDQTGITGRSGSQESRGAELRLAGSGGRAGIAWLFSYGYVDAELTRFAETLQLQTPPFFAVLDRSGNTPAFAPEHTARLWLSKHFCNGFGIAGGARYVSERFIAPDNAVELDDFLTLDLTLSYLWQDWQFSLFLENIGDEDYETRGIQPSAAVTPADGFHLTGEIRFRF